METDTAYEAVCSSSCDKEGKCGTTAVAVLVWGRYMTVANLGDSRAVISRRGRAIELTQDQKPTTVSERERILEAGGFVCCDGYLNSVLGVSRAIGNWRVRDQNQNLLKVRAIPLNHLQTSFLSCLSCPALLSVLLLLLRLPGAQKHPNEEAYRTWNWLHLVGTCFVRL